MLRTRDKQGSCALSPSSVVDTEAQKGHTNDHGTLRKPRDPRSGEPAEALHSVYATL